MSKRTEYFREYRQLNRDKTNEIRSRYRKTEKGRRQRSTEQTLGIARKYTFVGVDGEGYTDAEGVHHYMCLIAGKRVLYTGKPLSTEECLEFIAALPVEKHVIYVGYFFDYDSTMILRGFAQNRPDKAKRLLNVKPREYTDAVMWSPKPYGAMVNWRDYGVDYVPKKHLSVSKFTGVVDEKGKKVYSKKVTIHDVRSFYQCKFSKALNTFDVGSKQQRAHIEKMKALRAEFDPNHADEIIEYSKLECELLAQLVGNLRDAFLKAKLSAWPFEGPGPVAGRVLEKHVTGKKRMKIIREKVPKEVWDYASHAYYGGRFEILGHGTVSVPVYEYDLKSAYPHGMTRLPCLLHGEWSHVIGRPKDPNALWVGYVRWDADIPITKAVGVAGPLPFRTSHKSIHFPLAGSGWYWSVEVPDYAQVIDAWVYHRKCDCKPFEWVRDLYDMRATMERVEKGSGIGLKLTLNSLYGKLAQRIGSAPHYNPVWAGLITAITRSRVYEVSKRHPTVMFATDAVFLTEQAPELDIGTNLGQWELAGVFTDLCIFQPGVYFDGPTAKFKTRGVAKNQFAERADEFRGAANDFDLCVELDLSNHLGLKLALSYGEAWHDKIGNWVPLHKSMNANPLLKRRLIPEKGLVERNGVKWSLPIYGDMTEETVCYSHDDDTIVFEDAIDWEDGLYDGD